MPDNITATDASESKKSDRQQAIRLNHVLHAANALCLAYRTALRRLEDPDLSAAFEDLDKSHDRLRVELADCVDSLGHTPTEKADFKGVIERGRVVLGDLSGDEGIIRAMAKNEEEMAAALREALHHGCLPEAAVTILKRALVHEVEHHSFYNKALGRFVG